MAAAVEINAEIQQQLTMRLSSSTAGPTTTFQSQISGYLLLTAGARESAFRNIKTIIECFADELINAAKRSSNSYAIKKKNRIERVAKPIVKEFSFP